MKQLYSGALVVLTLTFFSLTASAQFTGGTYTAVTGGLWHNTGSPIWLPTEPPQPCNNCLIQIFASDTVHLNTSVTLTNGSKIVIGGTGGTNSTLKVDASTATGFAGANNILLDGTGTSSVLNTTDNTSFLDARNVNQYDGILQTQPGGTGITNYIKLFGSPQLFYENDVPKTFTNAAYGDTLRGQHTLNSSGTLPIILGSFNATVENGSVDLAWTTDLEINSDHFTIESSANAGESWKPVGTVAAQGNSSGVTNYSFVDSHPAQGTSEYRLALVDRDGNTAYSSVKAVRIGSIAAVNVYPNPATDYVNVTLTGEASVSANIRLVNLAGQVLLEKNVTSAGGTTVPVAVSSLPSGNYLIVVTGSDGSKQINKILIAR